MNMKIQENKEKINEKIRETKESIEQKQKISKENIEQKIENIRISSEEFTNQVKERFKNKSILKGRLIDAFPDLKIDEKDSDGREYMNMKIKELQKRDK